MVSPMQGQTPSLEQNSRKRKLVIGDQGPNFFAIPSPNLPLIANDPDYELPDAFACGKGYFVWGWKCVSGQQSPSRLKRLRLRLNADEASTKDGILTNPMDGKKKKTKDGTRLMIKGRTRWLCPTVQLEGLRQRLDYEARSERIRQLNGEW
jgi:hypothetical protein